LKRLIVTLLFVVSPVSAEPALISEEEAERMRTECSEIGREADQASEWANDREGYQDAKRLVWYRPKYPYNSPRHWFSCVVVGFDVDEKRRTDNVELLGRRPEDLPYGFYLKTREAILKWKYAPALKDGRPIRREGRVAVVVYDVRRETPRFRAPIPPD